MASVFFSKAEELKKKTLFSQRIGKNQWKDISWKQAQEKVVQIAKSLKAVGIKDGDRVLIVSENRHEWGLIYMGIISAGGIVVPAYTTNTSRDHAHVVEDSGVSIAFVSNTNLYNKLYPAVVSAQRMHTMIAIDDIALAQKSALNIHGWNEFISLGQDIDFDPKAYAQSLKKEDICSLIYTSGTGGDPKGVMLEHRNILHNCENLRPVFDTLSKVHFISILPLSHSFEMTIGLCACIYYGGRSSYFPGLENLIPSMQEQKPSVLLGVPRIYELFKSRIEAEIEKLPPTKRKISLKAIELGLRKHNKEKLSLKEKIQFFFLNQLVQKKLKKKFGNLEVAASGGAPLEPSVNSFLCAIGIPVLQGYGQTESAPIISFNMPNAKKDHTVGPAIGNQEIRFTEEGELLVKGDHVMRGYWNNQAETKKTIINDWLHTGDIAHQDDDGHIIITGRKKDMIVLSSGENISPARIEGLLILKKEIGQAVIYGDRKKYLTALIVPDQEFLETWAKKEGKSSDLSEIHDDEDLHKILMKAVAEVSKDLSALEKVKRIAIAPEAFSQENGLLTSTLKVRRQFIIQKYLDNFEELYS